MLDDKQLTSVEICAGGGGQALGIEGAGFDHKALVEQNGHACTTLRQNRPDWNVIEKDVRDFHPDFHRGAIDLLAGGIPCTPYSAAGKQLGAADERDLLPEALRLAESIQPRAIMLENVPELIKAPKFHHTREALISRLAELGYQTQLTLLNAKDFGVPQHRVRAVVVAMRGDLLKKFSWPLGHWELAPTVGQVLEASMAARGWAGAKDWSRLAVGVAPTLVGGSMKHGGGDLGPDGAKKRWARLAVNGNSLADHAPGPDFRLQHGIGRGGRLGYPKLTTAQAALIQGFPDDWRFSGGKTARYKQIGNAFPPPVARAVAESIAIALRSNDSHRQ